MKECQCFLEAIEFDSWLNERDEQATPRKKENVRVL